MNQPPDPAQYELRYGRARSVGSAIVLTAGAIGLWGVLLLWLSQGGDDPWPIIVGFGAILLLTTALAVSAIGMAIGPNEIRLTHNRLTIRRGFESVSVPWSAVRRLEDRRDRANGIPMQFLEVHVDQRADITYGGSGRLLARLGRSSSPVLAIPLRAGIPLVAGHDADSAAAIIRRYFVSYAPGRPIGRGGPAELRR